LELQVGNEVLSGPKFVLEVKVISEQNACDFERDSKAMK
jgi:hypothetical protein